MTTKEFSDSFDTLLNSYSTQPIFGEDISKIDLVLDEYEKSYYLTRAQEELVVNFYSGRNSLSDSFEKTEELRRYLSSLINTEVLSPVINPQESLLSDKSQVFNLPDNLWFITYEAVKLGTSSDKCLSDKELEVIPITQDDFYDVKDNPFRGLPSDKVLRLDLSDNKVELVSNYIINQYLIRYIKQIPPIVLIDLPNDLSINGISTQTECTLNPSIHRFILDRAVELAIMSKVPNMKSK